MNLELKCYIAGDEHIEALQKSRGYRSFRDLYQKKISEAESTAKTLRESQIQVKVSTKGKDAE